MEELRNRFEKETGMIHHDKEFHDVGGQRSWYFTCEYVEWLEKDNEIIRKQLAEKEQQTCGNCKHEDAGNWKMQIKVGKQLAKIAEVSMKEMMKEINRYLAEHSIRELSKKTGKSRNTITKIVRNEPVKEKTAREIYTVIKMSKAA